MQRLQPLEALDRAQTAAAGVIARIGEEQWDLPTPCDEWSVRDVANKMLASTLTFAAFGRRAPLDPALDLVNPVEMLGDDPLGAYLDAAADCRAVWRAQGALEGTAPSTVGEFPAKAVLNARIFDTTVLTWDISAAIGLPSGIDAPLAGYVQRVAEALVPTVRAASPERYKDRTEADPSDPVATMIAVTGRNPAWAPRP